MTSVPGLAVLFTPLTALVGPAAAFNTAEMLVPARLGLDRPTSCAGTSRARVVGLARRRVPLRVLELHARPEAGAHAHDRGLPAAAHRAGRRPLPRGEVDGRGLAWRLGVLFGLQFWLSTEVLLTAALALLVSGSLLAYGSSLDASRAAPHLAAAGWEQPESRSSSPHRSPITPSAASGPVDQHPAPFDGDLLNFVLPTHFVWAGGSALASISSHFRGNDAEAGAYLGIPTLVIVAWFGLGARRSSTVRYLLAALGLAVVVTLGTGVVVKGRIEAWLPWRLISGLPLFNNILTGPHLCLRGARRRGDRGALDGRTARLDAMAAAPALAVAALVPDLSPALLGRAPGATGASSRHRCTGSASRGTRTSRSSRSGLGRLDALAGGVRILVPDAGGIPDAQPARREPANDPMIRCVTYTGLRTRRRIEIVAFVATRRSTGSSRSTIYTHPNRRQMRRFGEVQDIGGVLVSPACGYPSCRRGSTRRPSARLTMARLDVAGDELILHLSLLERLGGFVHGDARIPLTNVWRARAVESPWEELRGVRSPGHRLVEASRARHLALLGRQGLRRRPPEGAGRRRRARRVEFARLVVSTPDAEAVAAEIERNARYGIPS